MKNRIKQLEENLEVLGNKVGRLQGEHSTLIKRLKETQDNITTCESDKEKLSKAVELLTLVQGVTRDKIKDGFEQIVTHALQYIYDDSYSFELEFGRRGNLQELDFNIKTPGFEEACSPLDTSGGGVLDIISLALRCVLLEVSVPKIEGFILFDESFKHLSKDYLPFASEFLNELNKRLNRQIILISHQSEFIDNAQNSIEVK
jgi:DNA repair exonuclease SbcCD ATPase subunit